MKTRILLTAAIALGAVATSQAQFALVTNRSDIVQNDMIDWGQFGPSFTSVGSPAFGATTGGVLFSATGPGNTQEIRVQGNGWAGNFNAGDNLLWSQVSGSSTIQLAQTVGAIGFQIQDDFFGSFTATIAAYDNLGNLLGSGTYSENGTSTSNGDNSAIFIGVTTGNNTNNIGKIVYNVTDGNGNSDYAINQVSIHECSTVPEPTTIAALGLGAVALLRRRRK